MRHVPPLRKKKLPRSAKKFCRAVDAILTDATATAA
jgi:hypothetical protein